MLKEVPNDSMDLSVNTFYYSQSCTGGSQSRTNRFWNRAAADGLLTSWSWWHRASIEPYVEKRGALLQNMMNSRYIEQRHYVDFVRFHLEEQRWGTALQSALQRMTQFPTLNICINKRLSSLDMRKVPLGETTQTFSRTHQST